MAYIKRRKILFSPSLNITDRRVLGPVRLETNGTFKASDYGVDGFNEVIVQVSGGDAQYYTLTISTTGTGECTILNSSLSYYLEGQEVIVYAKSSDTADFQYFEVQDYETGTWNVVSGLSDNNVYKFTMPNHNVNINVYGTSNGMRPI